MAWVTEVVNRPTRRGLIHVIKGHIRREAFIRINFVQTEWVSYNVGPVFLA